jgi:hypothetical protein
MSYSSIHLLNQEPVYAGRVRACVTEQAASLTGDANLATAACANAGLRGDPVIMDTFVRTTSSAPGLGDKVDVGDGTIDSTLIVDDDILAAIQANFPRVAALFFNDEGVRVA